ncbi:transporter substrate-binding domain-containing protein [Sedimentibacter hydroxybenzoicus DSM 7310]|uniref:histidine kinase n=1 Tax=Sedimentibacter hydroxybenzoicus DSM 7310 TaxID=1123245 RepID=A0A974BJX7_SEDHY|nr:transporter substrate-binding domain-containing protein [Sedimentibacter hydroxybenzoicus]NYB74554.1 transporter substrate-binding domain-containing protein [Sedimentibacter hydroxybenzoicus DSM 7310]
MKKKNAIVIITFFMLILIIQFFITNNEKYLTKDEIKWLKEQEAIIYAANENAPPLRFVDEIDNQYKGVVVDVVNQLSLELGIDIQTVPMKWDDALLSLKEGRTQMCDMFINRERSQNYLFTDPIYNLRTVLLTRADDNFDTGNINSMKIATELGDYANSYLIENYPDAELIYTHNVEEGLELFLNGTVDAVIGDEPIITFLLVEKNENLNPKYSNIILYQQEVVFAVAKDKPELVQILNKAIPQLKSKGQLEKIQQKWFGISTPLIDTDNSSELIKTMVISFVIASIVVGGIFVLIIFNNFSLQRLVKKRTTELENSRNELQIIFDGISDFMLVIDKDKNVLKINKSFNDYAVNNGFMDRNAKCTEYINKFCSDCTNCLLDDAYKQEKNINKEVTAGHDVFEMNFQPLKDANNTVLITIKNITLDKINRNKMLQTNKMIAVGQLAAGLAHEIRNPLGIIRTQSYLLRINEKIDDAAYKSLDYIDVAVKRASKIIDNILSFSRFSSKAEKLIDVNQLIERLIEIHNEAIKKYRIIVNVESNIKEQIQLNVESVEHIILNLISNSIDAMNDGGILGLKTKVEDNIFTIICEDNGCGIDEHNINNIFDPFFTTKELGKGTGLGLFIVYSEVEKLGGKIDVKSKLGEGTTFIITIPFERKKS